MEERRQRERELVLAPNEFAYVLDTTKGHINCYVGPNKTSLAQTDQPVVLNPRSQRFESAELSNATSVFPTATAASYVILHNPALDGAHPKLGVSNASVDLKMGQKITLRGPCSFPLWPGQIAEVIEGHRMRTNEYVLVRVYDAELADAEWTSGRPAEAAAEGLTIGDLFVVRGTELSFFVPPNGLEVVRGDDGEFIRRAVTLQRLEYCVLAGEDGKEVVIRGEAVVFPNPDQTFFRREGRRRFKAYELSETTGIHVKVIAAYEEKGVEFSEGEELFLTGKNLIYFPRSEHAIIRYGANELYHAIAIPRGQGRYVLSRSTGEVRLVRGPCMFLPDPREDVLTRRILTADELRLYYPEAVVSEATVVMSAEAPAVQTTRERGFTRGFQSPRVITLDTSTDDALRVPVASGFAIEVVNSAGERRVVEGPETTLLEYDETLSALSLSTGSPKSDKQRLRTVFLQTRGNRVSDIIRATSSDMVDISLNVAYRVNFDRNADPSEWFRVDDYVKLLCEHASSLIKAATRIIPIRELQERATEIVRDSVLGAETEAGRSGRRFAENNMVVYDVEVLSASIDNAEVTQLLKKVRTETLQRTIHVLAREREFEEEARLAQVERKLMQQVHETRLLGLELAEARSLQAHAGSLVSQLQNGEMAELEQLQEKAEAALEQEITLLRLQTTKAEHEGLVAQQEDALKLRVQELVAQVEAAKTHAQAYSPHLVQALNRLADEKLLRDVAGEFSELAAIEGRGLLETARKFLDFVPATTFPMLATHALAEAEE